MKSSHDPLIYSLVKKKKELLNQLLIHSIQSAIDEQNIETTVQNREVILTALSTNDRALEIREKELGVTAKTIEVKLFKDIAGVLEAIQENNKQTIVILEKEQREIERERSRLGKENKLSGYITQKKSYRNGISARIMENTPQGSGMRLLNGTL
ncbi:MAG: hypothetical protein HN580_29070 [Deltaproteobacteria bacterium]|nr:hypothetical protein [Deltaproteobacteria bacterium]MBT4091560.1 hypothetical protein [Deltaproteobacteria bacterium]MBT4267277.1 hypothetical protein [Deltaproteobacteria bacterium]MBT4639369.1 hypothetical protein [Deltaproteobacteria bacterium]MBT6504862.1 hypothetical protein [Deltaproteobacteria bacterium]